MVAFREQVACLLVALPALTLFTACGTSSHSPSSSAAGARGGTSGTSSAPGGAGTGARAGTGGQGGAGTAGGRAPTGGMSGSAASPGGAGGAASGNGGVSSAGTSQGGDASAGESGSPSDAGAAGMDGSDVFEATQGTRDGIRQSPFCSSGPGCNGACVDFIDNVGEGGCSYVLSFKVYSVAATTTNLFLAWGQTGFIPVDDTFKGNATEVAIGDLYSTALALDSNYLYALGLSSFNGSSEWQTSVYRLPLAGGDAERLAYGGINPADVAVDATHVYFSELQGGWALHRAPIAGGSTVDLAQSTQIRHVALSDDAVYFTEKDPPALARIFKADIPESLPKCPTGSPDCYTLPEPGMETATRTALDPSHVEILDDSGAMYGLALAGGAVYYANETAKTLTRLNPDGSRDLIMHGAVAHVLATDDTHLYWIEDETGFIMSLPLAGGPPRTVGSVTAISATSMAITGNLIYVATQNGVTRQVKP